MKTTPLVFAASSALISCSSLTVSAFSNAATKTYTAAASSPSRSVTFCSSVSSTTRLYQFATAQQGLVDIADINTPRDVYSLEEWATQYGMQKTDGVELYSDDGFDYQLITQSDIPAGQTVVFVPADLVLNSATIEQEFGTSLQQAEEALVRIDESSNIPQGAEYRLPLFRLMVKILVEYEKGQESVYYPWLNSLPRQFFNGVSMTKACFKCLPPYASFLTQNERINCSHFTSALKEGYVPLSQETIEDKELTKWAYNVALTRFHEVWQPERAKVIGPMADMLNHASEPNCEISVDYEGNVNVMALYDIPAGSSLTISLGDPTNPTPLFAQYGFLPQDCITVFCKAIHLTAQIQELGYNFNELLFQTETGEIGPKVWDIFLYEILQTNDPDAAQQFYMACINNDEATKQQCHEEYFAYTLPALKKHVNSILKDAGSLTKKAQSYSVNTHPRVPVIVAHNQLVIQTFTMIAAALEQMG